MRNLSDYTYIIIMTSIIMCALFIARIVLVINGKDNRTFSRNGEINLIGDSQSFKC